jgi:8-oxo-dGTP diphosphatase
MARTLWVTAAVMLERDRVLLTQRKPGGDHPGLWEFPGGKVHDGEEPRAALARELAEELGIDVEVGAIVELSFTPLVIPGEPERSVALLFFEVRRSAGSADPQPIDVADLRWYALDELSDEMLPPGDRPMLAKLRSSQQA